jgi:hypothetical protein
MLGSCAGTPRPVVNVMSNGRNDRPAVSFKPEKTRTRYGVLAESRALGVMTMTAPAASVFRRVLTN